MYKKHYCNKYSISSNQEAATSTSRSGSHKEYNTGLVVTEELASTQEYMVYI